MKKIVLICIFSNILLYSDGASRNSPQLEAPLLLNSYLPAAMQIISHLTDLMKYDVKPATPSTTTPKPTSPHRPGIFAPTAPPNVPASRMMDHIQEHPDEVLLEVGRSNDGKMYVFESLPDDLDLLGQAPSQLLHLVNIMDDNNLENEDEQVLKFLDKYDDYNVKQYIVGNKKTPPTRAYVTLLSLYDQLNAEAKKLKLNKYGGYTSIILRFLQEKSGGTSSDQLLSVLKKVIQNKDTDNNKVIERINNMIKDLETSNSYVNQALQHVPPLHFEYLA